MAANFQNDLTEGSVSKQLWRFSLPFLGAMILQALYNVADMLIVGWFCSDNGISAVGLAGNFTITVTNMIIGLATGGTVMIAQYAGAKMYEDEKKTVATLFSVYGIAALFVTVVLVPLVPVLVNLMNPPNAQVYQYSVDYLYICFGGTVFIFGYNAVSAVLRGMGNSKSPLLFVAISAITNIILDFVLVGAGMGPAGAAIATVASQALSFVISVIYLKKRDFIFDFHPKSFKIDREKARMLIKLGLPTSLQNTFVSISFILLNSLVNTINIFASSAYAIGSKVNSFAILPGIAMCQSVASMCGQNIGAGLYDRAMKTMKGGIKIALGITLLICAIIVVFPELIMSAFNADVQTQTEGANFLRALAGDAVISSFLFNMNGLLLGGGHTNITLMAAAINSLLIRAPLAYLFVNGMNMGITGIGLAMAIAPIGGIAFDLLYMRGGRWKQRRINVDNRLHT